MPKACTYNNRHFDGRQRLLKFIHPLQTVVAHVYIFCIYNTQVFVYDADMSINHAQLYELRLLSNQLGHTEV